MHIVGGDGREKNGDVCHHCMQDSRAVGLMEA